MPRVSSIDADNDPKIKESTWIDYDAMNEKGKPIHVQRMAQGFAKKATRSDLERDALGFTHPNLHHRVEEQAEIVEADDPRNQEIAPRVYKTAIMNVHEYRFEQTTLHDEESIDNEIP